MRLKYSIVACLSVFLLACDDNGSLSDDFKLTTSTPPLDVQGKSVRYYEDLAYGDDERQVLDVIVPQSFTPVPLIVYIHGGGFTTGDKANLFNYRPDEVNQALAQGIAFASINYRLLQENDPVGIDKSMEDSRRALQYIRHLARDLNIDKNNIALYGVSAGAGASLWVGLNDEMADLNGSTADLVDDESTRVKGIAITEVQATYDLVKWETEIMQPLGWVTLDLAGQLGQLGLLFSFYGMDPGTVVPPGQKVIDILTSDLEVVAYRERVDLLELMTPDDPELWIYRDNRIIVAQPNSPDAGAIIDWIYHHPYQAKALYDRANIEGIPNVTSIPELGIIDPSGEDALSFLVRKLTN